MPTRLANGRYWARPMVNGKRVPLGTYETREEAADTERAYALRELSRPPELPPDSLEAYAQRWHAQRIASGLRSAERSRMIWACYLSGTALSRMPLRAIRRAHVVEWLDALALRKKRDGDRLGRGSLVAAVGALHSCLNSALERDLVEFNPSDRVKPPREVRTHEPWSYLEPADQRRLMECEAIPRRDRLVFGVTMGLGLRVGEMISLERADVSATEVTVRYGGRNRAPTKSGKPRTIPLFGLARVCMAEWLRDYYQPGRQWVFHALRGGQRWQCQPVGAYGPAKNERSRFGHYLELAGVKPIRYHDLRHTCATSLLCGWWGRPWTLAEIAALLGHSLTAVTARYAHLGPSMLRLAAAETDDRRQIHVPMPTGEAPQNTAKMATNRAVP